VIFFLPRVLLIVLLSNGVIRAVVAESQRRSKTISCNFFVKSAVVVARVNAFSRRSRISGAAGMKF
jgi:hypothetical protein